MYRWINSYAQGFSSSLTRYQNIYFSKSVIVYVWDIVEVIYHPIPKGRPQLETSLNTKMVGIMLLIIISLWITRKAVVMDISFCVLNRLLEMRKRGVYWIALIKIGNIGLWGFVRTSIMGTSGKKLVMFDILVVDGMKQSSMFLFWRILIIILSGCQTFHVWLFGGSEIIEKDFEWWVSQVQVSLSCLWSL